MVVHFVDFRVQYYNLHDFDNEILDQFTKTTVAHNFENTVCYL